MAVRYAAATGNWSSVATWDGGASLPAAGDAPAPVTRYLPVRRALAVEPSDRLVTVVESDRVTTA